MKEDNRRQQSSGVPDSPRRPGTEPSPAREAPPFQGVRTYLDQPLWTASGPSSDQPAPSPPPPSPPFQGVRTYLDQPLWTASGPSSDQPAPLPAPHPGMGAMSPGEQRAATAQSPALPPMMSGEETPRQMHTYYHVTPEANLGPSPEGPAMEASEGILQEGLKVRHGGSARGTKRVEKMGLEYKDKNVTHLTNDPELARSYYDAYEKEDVPAAVLQVQLSPRGAQRLEVDTGHTESTGMPKAFRYPEDIPPERIQRIPPPPPREPRDIGPPPPPPPGWAPGQQSSTVHSGPRYADPGFFKGSSSSNNN